MKKNQGTVQTLKARFATQTTLVLIIILISLFSLMNINMNAQYVRNVHALNLVVGLLLLFLFLMDKKIGKI